jgi:hypothetical protein
MESLPDLREDHYALIRSGDHSSEYPLEQSSPALAERYALVNVETDRITNTLNTLAGEIFRWTPPR